jgi:hypothetical protein
VLQSDFFYIKFVDLDLSVTVVHTDIVYPLVLFSQVALAEDGQSDLTSRLSFDASADFVKRVVFVDGK